MDKKLEETDKIGANWKGKKNRQARGEEQK